MRDDRAKGLLFGLAIGGAGIPTGASPLSEQAAARFGTSTANPPRPTYADSVQAALDHLDALLNANAQPCHHERLASTKMAAADGNAVLLRAMLIGSLYRYNLEQMRQMIVTTLSIPTPGEAAAGLGVAYLTKLALDNAPPSGHLRAVFEVAGSLNENFDAALRRVGHVLGWGDEAAALAHIGAGETDEEIVALALYCTMRYPNDLAAGVRRAGQISEVGSRLAGIVGGLLGARLGLNAIPTAWLQSCEEAAYLNALGSRLVQAWERGT